MPKPKTTKELVGPPLPPEKTTTEATVDFWLVILLLFTWTSVATAVGIYLGRRFPD